MYGKLISVHICIAAIALASGTIAVVSTKGSHLHIRAGRIYVNAMYGVVASAILLTILKFNPFLSSIALFALYFTYSGKKSIGYRRLKHPYTVTLKDRIHIYLALIIALFMVFYPVTIMMRDHILFVPVLSIFGMIMFAAAVFEMKIYADLTNFRPGNEKWLSMHIGQMGGGYISCITAFLLNNIHFSPSWVIWLFPAAIGIPAISFSIIKTKKKNRRVLQPYMDGKQAVPNRGNEID